MENKNYLSLFLLLLFSYLVVFTSQQKHQGTDEITKIEFDHLNRKVEYEVENSKKNQRFYLTFSNEQNIPYFMKVEVTVVGDYPTPLLCFSPTDSNCNDNRQQIVKNPNDKSTLMWLKREQFTQSEQNLNIKVICEKEGAAYILKFEGDIKAYFSPDFVYSYYIGTYNKEMNFEIIGNGKKGSLVAAIEGSKSAVLEMESGYTVPFETGQISYMNINEEFNDTITTIKVKGVSESLITLSVHLIEDNGITEFLKPNGPEITGYLEKNFLVEECFKISSFETTYKNFKYFYLTGRIHSQYALILLKDETGKNIVNKYEVMNGQLSVVIDSEYKTRQICVNFPQNKNIEANNLFYTLSLEEPTSLSSLYNYYPPQIPGYIYRRFLPKGKIAFFSPMKLDESAKKYDYKMYLKAGMAKMAIAKCSTYPECKYNNLDGLEIPKSSNQMSIWTTYDGISSTIGNEKNVIVVQCLDDDNEKNGYCLFETSFFNKGEQINLVLDEKFSHYALAEEKGTFRLNLGVGVKLQRVTVDIMIFSGDVSFDLKESLDIDGNKMGNENIQLYYHKYYLSNKIFFHFNLAQLSLIELIFEFKASLNSFFTIQYGYGQYNLNQLEETLPSGEHYLVQIDPTSSTRRKTVHLQNFRNKSGKPFLSNFFALNCEFEVKRGDSEIEFFDGYAQEVLTTSSKNYTSNTYDYQIKIKEPDLANYNHKMCMIYVSGVESKDDYEREIIVGENINQQIIFEDGFEKIRFLYPQADNGKDLAINVNIIDQTYYKISVFLNNNEKAILSETITRTQIFYISGSQISDICKKNTLCSVIVQVELTTGVHEFTKTNPMIEITIRQIKNIPSYIQKGLAKIDFTCGDKFYYLYTDIGKNEIGEVLIDFHRDFGNIWGKIVRKDQSQVDEEANWRGIYRMPSDVWEDSLEYNRYIKKLLIRPEDTQDCIEGCYLLMSIQISQIGEYADDFKFYPFTILTRITPNNRAYTDIPKIVIQVDEYIIGNVDVSDNERIYEFYEVWLPHDAVRVDFDWQSSVAGLYINLNGIRPTTKNADFKLLPPGKDSILSLTKEEILKKFSDKKLTPPYKDSIQDINLVVSVWTDKTSSSNTEIYSLRIHEVDESDKLDIIEVKADKKTLCKPHQLLNSDQYRCLFMITYDNDDTIKYTPFIAHGSSVSPSAETNMYASFVERNIFDDYDDKKLTQVIPTLETAVYNTKYDGVDYIYIKLLDTTKYLFINVITDSAEDIMMITNMPLYNMISNDDYEFYPTPGKEQILSVSNDKLILEFPTDKSILVNIVSLTGEAEISWQKDVETIYNLRGRGDRLTLSSGEASDKLVIHKRIVNYNNLNEKMENPGFLFYISYYLKEKQNFDEIIYGKSLEFAYKDTDLPVVLYSKIGSYDSDINVAVTFKDLDTINAGIYEYAPLSVRASLIKESTIYKAKKDPDLTPSLDRLILGSYDTALKTAQVMISRETINSYNFKQNDNPSVYLSINKNKDIPEKVYNKFSVEVQFSKANEGIIPTEKVYHYGRIGEESRMTFYKLRFDKQKPLMRVQIAFNNNNINYCISENYYIHSNLTFMSEERERGKRIITINSTELPNIEYIYLFFFKIKLSDNKALYNYVYKYINAKTLEEFIDYKIFKNENIIYKEIKKSEQNEYTLECTFKKIDVNKTKANITYFLKVVDADSYLKGEEINTIAVMESPYYSVFVRNPEDKEGDITLVAKNISERWTLLQIIAQIQQETILEYVAYKGIYVYREPIDENGKDQENDEYNEASAIPFYVIGGILFALALGLIITVIIFKIQNKELVEQVKHVSFQKTNSSNYNNQNNNNYPINSVDSSNLIQS